MKKWSPASYVYLDKNDRSAKSKTIVAEFSISHVSLFGFCANANTGNGCATEAAEEAGWKLQSRKSMCFAFADKIRR